MRKKRPEGEDILEVIGATTMRDPRDIGRFMTRDTCRLCFSPKLRRVLDLPATPLANEFTREPEQPGKVEVEIFPLYLMSCAACGHVQLPVVVDPDRLFRDYVYVSGTSPVFVEHFARYAAETTDWLKLEKGDFVIDIGSNDGTLLREYQKLGMRVLGIDPAVEIAKRATESGIETWPKFFYNSDAIERILAEKGPAKLVVANNVFAHSDDLEGFALGVKQILEPGGHFVFEVSYLVDVLRNTLFDTIYHEHLSYHSVEPLYHFFARLGMSLVDARRVDTHGGSIRVIVQAMSGVAYSENARELMTEEQMLFLATNPQPIFSSFANTINERGSELRAEIEKIKQAGGRVAGYGAPAKATTLLSTFGLEEQLDFVVDDSPHKQGRWLPGGRLRVVPIGALDRGASEGWLRGEWPAAVVILAWNFAEPIVKIRLASYRATGGVCIVPLPTVRVIS